MKTKIFRFALFIMIVSLALAGMVSNSSAQGMAQFNLTPTATGVAAATVPPPAIEVAAGTPIQTVNFTSLDTPDTTLNGPYDSMSVDFSLPPNWQLLDGSEIQMFITAFTVSSAPSTTTDSIGATLDVSFNGSTVSSLILQSGTNVEYQIRIPVDALKPTRPDGRYTLYLFLDAGIDCDFAFHKTTVVVKGSSQFILPYAEGSVDLDLGKLPQPIYQKSAIIPSQAMIVVPQAPTADQLRAAMITSAGFGRMTGGSLLLNLISADQLTPEIENNYHLIFVGGPADFAPVTPLDWPASAKGGKFATDGLQPDDGLLQMIRSPWNAGRVLLWVGGNSDAGLVKAAQALSTGAVKPIFERNKVIIADTKPFVDAAQNVLLNTPVERTFADLGYGIETVNGAGFSQINYEFYIPPGLAPSEKPYIDLNFTNSSLLDQSLSGMVVYLNDVQIASERLSQDTSVLTTKRITIPQNLVSMGANQIRIDITMIPTTQCSLFNFSNLWMTVFPESLLHIVLQPATVAEATAGSLQDYPNAFTNFPNLSNIAFLLPKNDVVAWRTAAQVAFDLGQRVQGAMLELNAYYDGEIPAGQRENHDLFLVGLPVSLPTIAELKDRLPVPFEQGNNLAIVQGEGVVYRVPDNVSLGYIELLPSPWGQAHTILAVLGSNSEGLAFAGNGLTVPSQQSNLFGNFAALTSQDVISANTDTGAGLASLTTGLAPVATPIVITPAPGPGSGLTTAESWLTRTDYIPMALIVIILLVGGILVWAFRANRKRGETS